MRKINNYIRIVGCWHCFSSNYICYSMAIGIAIAMASMKCNENIFSISRHWLHFPSQSCVNWLGLAWPVMAGLGFFYNCHSATAFLCIHFHLFFFSLFGVLLFESKILFASAQSTFGTYVNNIHNVRFPHWITIKSFLSFTYFWQSKWNIVKIVKIHSWDLRKS